MDLALRPGPQSTLPPIPNNMTFSVAIGTIKINKCITAVSTVNIPKPRRSCS